MKSVKISSVGSASVPEKKLNSTSQDPYCLEPALLVKRRISAVRYVQYDGEMRPGWLGDGGVVSLRLENFIVTTTGPRERDGRSHYS